MISKRCMTCKEEKPLSDFGPDTSKKDGINIYCRPCFKIKSRLINRRIRENDQKRLKLNEYQRAWRAANRKSVLETRKKANKKRDKKHNQARMAVLWSVKLGQLAPVTSLECIRCGVMAQEYHHYLGYEREHWLSVVPLCVTCHTTVHRELRRLRNAENPKCIGQGEQCDNNFDKQPDGGG